MRSKLSTLGFKRIGLPIGLTLALVLGGYVLLGCLAGCSTTRWAGIESGEYAVVSDRGEANEVAMRAIRNMKIDRDERVAVFALADSSEIMTSFVPRDRTEWPAGCPEKRIGSTVKWRTGLLDNTTGAEHDPAPR